MEIFVPFEIAKKLKEKGFREKCMWHYYDDTKDIYKSSSPQCYNYGGNTSDAPTISQVLKWLRDEKYIHIIIDFFTYIDTNKTYWYYSVKDIKDGVSYTNYMYKGKKSYENSALAGIEYVLDLI